MTTNDLAEQPSVYLDIVHVDGLHPVGRRPPIDAYLHALWGRRHFIWADSHARVTSSTRGMVLGKAWLVLKPLLDGCVYLVIFGMLLKTDRGIDNFIGYLLVGVLMFGYSSRCLSSGAASITGGRNLVKSFQFPRAALPIAAVLRETLNSIPGFATLIVLVLAIPPHAQVTWRWALFPAIIALQLIFNLGIAMIAARLVAHVPDLSHLISLLTRFWLYGSAVFFSLDQFVDHPAVLSLMQANPLYAVLDMTRDVLLYARTPEISSWLILSIWAVGALMFGLIYFWNAEESYGKE